MWARSATAPHRVVSQAKALLMAGDGVANSRIATALGISRPTVLDWRARFRTEGLDSVGAVRPGRGRKPEITADQVQAIVHSTLHETPPGATHWSCRSMAKAAGVSRSTVQRIWDAHGLQPHRVTTFKLSKDPAFVQKLTDIVGLYLNPPDQAVVLCVDEKSRIQALDRTRPGLPMKPGRCGTMTHDYKRHGTTTFVRCAERADRQGHRPVSRPASAPGIPEVPAAPRPRVPARPHPAGHPGQLRDPRARGGSPLAGGSPALRTALHADGSLVAQPRRELVQPTDATTASPRRLLQRAGTRGFGGFPKKLARTSPRCGGDRVGDHKPSLIRSRASWPQFLPRQAGLSPRTVSRDLWARSWRPRVRQLRQASLQRA